MYCVFSLGQVSFKWFYMNVKCTNVHITVSTCVHFDSDETL